MSLGSFGVLRLLNYVLLNKQIKSKRNVFFLLDFLLQAALVGNILWVIMFFTKEITTRNWIVLLIASLAAGLYAGYSDTKKIFGVGSKFKLPKNVSNDPKWMVFYVVFVAVYLVLLVLCPFVFIK